MKYTAASVLFRGLGGSILFLLFFVLKVGGALTTTQGTQSIERDERAAGYFEAKRTRLKLFIFITRSNAGDLRQDRSVERGSVIYKNNC